VKFFDIYFAVGEFLRIFGERKVISGERFHGEKLLKIQVN